MCSCAKYSWLRPVSEICALNERCAVELFNPWLILWSGLQNNRRNLWKGFCMVSSGLLCDSVAHLYFTGVRASITLSKLLGFGRRAVATLTKDDRTLALCGEKETDLITIVAKTSSNGGCGAFPCTRNLLECFPRSSFLERLFDVGGVDDLQY